MQSRRVSVLLVLLASQVVGLALVAAIAAAAGAGPPGAARILYGVAAGVVGALGLIAFYRGLATGAMGVVAPIAATAVFVPVAVGLARGEQPSALQAAGIGLAIVGVVAVSRQPGVEGGGVARGAGLAALSALCFGGALVGLAAASRGGAIWGALSLRVGGTPVALAVVAATRPRFAEVPRAAWLLLAGVGITDASASVLYGAATSRGLLSIVAVLASLYPVLVVVFARMFLDERIARTQVVGAAAALAGIALLSAG